MEQLELPMQVVCRPGLYPWCAPTSLVYHRKWYEAGTTRDFDWDMEEHYKKYYWNMVREELRKWSTVC